MQTTTKRLRPVRVMARGKNKPDFYFEVKILGIWWKVAKVDWYDSGWPTNSLRTSLARILLYDH